MGQVYAFFNSKSFHTKVGSRKTILKIRKKQIIFSQGDVADAVFYIEDGKVKLTVVSQKGKEAVVAVLIFAQWQSHAACPINNSSKLSYVEQTSGCLIGIIYANYEGG